ATAARRVRRSIHRIDPWSLLKFSLLFYLSVMLVFLVAAIILYLAASGAGIIKELERLIESLGLAEGFRIRPFQWLRGFLAIGVANVIVWSAVNVCAAFLYNMVSDVVGGVVITMSEREI
ncbi:MAG: DUF3566 domain-containing protein, partial [Acidimicrobiales bacterium]